jgi:uncharacterized membrane protein YeaQ/YmgE (transglycosylase-associated protein family)
VDVIDMNAQEPSRAQQQAEAAFYPTLAAIVGAVAGTLVTTALDKSPTVKLIGATLGAAIPPLIAAAGKFSRLRLFGGIVAAVVALVLTYVGFSVPETALGMQNTFPVPAGVNPTDDPTPTKTTTTERKPGHCEGQLCILVEPMQVHCSADQCDSAVEVTSTGTTRLRIADIEFRGDIADRFSQTGNCANEVLIKDEQCSITLHVAPGPGGTAQMRIHQNFKGPASVVSLEADTWPTTPPTTTTTPDGPKPDFTLSAIPRCYVIPGGQLSGADGLTLMVVVKNIGHAPYNGLVPFSLVSNTGLSAGGNTGYGSRDGTAMQVDLRSSDYQKSHRFTVTVDPDNVIDEEDESNNLLRIRVSLPTRPQQYREVSCTLI